jgi:hypothetical protein
MIYKSLHRKLKSEKQNATNKKKNKKNQKKHLKTLAVNRKQILSKQRLSVETLKLRQEK